MPYRDVAGILTDIGTEELAHLEMISTIVYQLCKGLSAEELKSSGLDVYFVDHTNGIWPQAASGNAFTSAYFQSKGDPITDLHEDMAAEQKARSTYDNILNLVTLLWYRNEFLGKVFVVNVGEVHIIKFHPTDLLELFFHSTTAFQSEPKDLFDIFFLKFPIGIDQLDET